MTQARTRAKGLVTPPLIQHWLEAALRAFVCLVQGVAATLGMIFNHTRRDWHTPDAREPLPQAKSDIHLIKDNSTHGVILGPVPRISVGQSKGFAIDPLETSNRDSRDKPENDSVLAAAPEQEADPLVRVPREGGDTVEWFVRKIA